MSEKTMKKSKAMLAALLGAVALTMLTMWGCGTSGYQDAPAPPAKALTAASNNALADAADLKGWIDSGLLNSTSGQKLVILEVADSSGYLTGHIPGAQLMSSSAELNKTRLEGIAQITTQVIDGPLIDSVIKRTGIDQNTTIVFSVNKGGSFLNQARAYFTFRYWGFPKERLKILNGGDDAWEAAGNALTTEILSVAPSSYSVKNNSSTNFGLRRSIGEMIGVVDAINGGTVSASDAAGVSILDVRGGAPAVYMAHATVDDYAQYSIVTAGKTSIYKDPADLVARLEAMGSGAQKQMTYVYCVSGTRATVPFFVMDGILGRPVNLYDGSWNQWSAYYLNTATAANNLPASSPWRVDNALRTTGALTTTGATALSFDQIANALYNPTDPRANQIKVEDSLYVAPVVKTDSAAGGGSGSGC